MGQSSQLQGSDKSNKNQSDQSYWSGPIATAANSTPPSAPDVPSFNSPLGSNFDISKQLSSYRPYHVEIGPSGTPTTVYDQGPAIPKYSQPSPPTPILRPGQDSTSGQPQPPTTILRPGTTNPPSNSGLRANDTSASTSGDTGKSKAAASVTKTPPPPPPPVAAPSRMAGQAPAAIAQSVKASTPTPPSVAPAPTPVPSAAPLIPVIKPSVTPSVQIPPPAPAPTPAPTPAPAPQNTYGFNPVPTPPGAPAGQYFTSYGGHTGKDVSEPFTIVGTDRYGQPMMHFASSDRYR
jgi:hypothetical protein